jgi:hypothetical protein
MTFARLFQYLVLPGQAQSYAAYLRDVVTVIDEDAHRAGIFDRLHTIIPDTAADWNHGRVFLFQDRAQRDGFAARMAERAAAFDGEADATARRKAYAETLRRLVGVVDFQID